MAADETDQKLIDETNKYLEYLKLSQKEWEVTINTQMHFNDLIIRYRQIFLTIFLTLITASFTLFLNGKINPLTVRVILIAIIVSWCLAFVLDYFYYHRMLLASVEYAAKFDENSKLKELALFGLTKHISDKVSQLRAKVVICSFYGIPIICLIFAAIFIPCIK